MTRLLLLLFILFCLPLHAEPPSLVDRLMGLLNGKMGPMKILPPPGGPPAPATAPRKASAAGGFEIPSSYFPIYDLDRGPDDTTPPLTLPFFSSAPVNAKRSNILSLIIMIPDSDREAARAYAVARGAQDTASTTHPEWYAGNAVVIAPQFLNPEDVAKNAAQWPDGGASLLTWAGGGWIYGADSAVNAASKTANPRGMSSYEVLDFILLAIARKEIFPDLERVVIAGSGAGGDFVQRYAALGLAPDILGNDNIKVRYVSANAWSYLYLDKTRAVAPENGVYISPNAESIFAEPKPDVCAAYNNFPYGMDVLPLYGKKQGETAIRLRYDSRVVLYLAGKQATNPLPDNSPQACAAVLEGKSLNARAKIYYQHLSKLYGDNLPQTQRFYEIPDTAEDASPLWRSACGMSVLFGDGACDKSAQ